MASTATAAPEPLVAERPDGEGVNDGGEPLSASSLRRAFLEDTWASEVRFERYYGVTCALICWASWLADYLMVGLSSLGLLLLLLRFLAGAAALPMVVASFLPRPPRWLLPAKLAFAAGVPLLLMTVFTLKPTNILAQGWAMVLAWAVVQVGRGPRSGGRC